MLDVSLHHLHPRTLSRNGWLHFPKMTTVPVSCLARSSCNVTLVPLLVLMVERCHEMDVSGHWGELASPASAGCFPLEPWPAQYMLSFPPRPRHPRVRLQTHASSLYLTLANSLHFTTCLSPSLGPLLFWQNYRGSKVATASQTLLLWSQSCDIKDQREFNTLQYFVWGEEHITGKMEVPAWAEIKARQSPSDWKVLIHRSVGHLSCSRFLPTILEKSMSAAAWE